MAGVVGALAVLVPASAAWACVGVMSLTTDVSTVDAGDTVTLFGRGFAQDEPIDVHFDGPDGPLLATVPAPESTMTSRFEVDVVIPDDVANGSYVLVATQDYHHMNAGAPARASINVGTDAPAPGTPASRPVALTIGSGPSAAVLVAVAVAVAVTGLFLAWLGSRWATRR